MSVVEMNPQFVTSPLSGKAVCRKCGKTFEEHATPIVCPQEGTSPSTDGAHEAAREWLRQCGDSYWRPTEQEMRLAALLRTYAAKARAEGAREAANVARTFGKPDTQPRDYGEQIALAIEARLGGVKAKRKKPSGI